MLDVGGGGGGGGRKIPNSWGIKKGLLIPYLTRYNVLPLLSTSLSALMALCVQKMLQLGSIFWKAVNKEFVCATKYFAWFVPPSGVSVAALAFFSKLSERLSFAFWAESARLPSRYNMQQQHLRRAPPLFIPALSVYFALITWTHVHERRILWWAQSESTYRLIFLVLKTGCCKLRGENYKMCEIFSIYFNIQVKGKKFQCKNILCSKFVHFYWPYIDPADTHQLL